MKYTEWKEARQQEFNKLPIFYAFGEKQFGEQLAKRGIDRKDAPKLIVSIGAGGFCLKQDVSAVKAFLEKDTEAELRAMMEADLNFAFDAFEYEMFNHEYPINWEGDYDVCSCFGGVDFSEDKYGKDYLKDLGFSDQVVKVYYKAAKKVQEAIEW